MKISYLVLICLSLFKKREFLNIVGDSFYVVRTYV